MLSLEMQSPLGQESSPAPAAPLGPGLWTVRAGVFWDALQASSPSTVKSQAHVRGVTFLPVCMKNSTAPPARRPWRSPGLQPSRGVRPTAVRPRASHSDAGRGNLGAPATLGRLNA